MINDNLKKALFHSYIRITLKYMSCPTFCYHCALQLFTFPFQIGFQLQKRKEQRGINPRKPILREGRFSTVHPPWANQISFANSNHDFLRFLTKRVTLKWRWIVPILPPQLVFLGACSIKLFMVVIKSVPQ